MMSPWVLCRLYYAHIILLLTILQDLTQGVTPATISTVVELGRSNIFKHRVEAEIGDAIVFNGIAVVEATRYNADTLLILTTKDLNEEAEPLVSGSGVGRAVVVKSLGGRVNSLHHHIEEDQISLNYKRALASLLSPVHHPASLAYHTQSDVLGTCEVHYKQSGPTTTTWRDLTRCSHFTSESVLGGHSLPLLHLGFEVLGSESQCEYHWRGSAGGILDGVACVETLKVAPRYSDEGHVLNITLTSTLTRTASSTLNPETYTYLQEATEATDLVFHNIQESHEDADSITSELLREICSSGEDGRLTGNLLQKFSRFTHAMARSMSETLPDISATCPIPIRRMVSIVAAIVGGPKALPLFITQLAEIGRQSGSSSVTYGDEFLFTLALRSLVDPFHPSAKSLPMDYFAQRQNQIVYEELVDYLLNQSPPAVGGVATLLEGLSKGAPELFKRLLKKSSSFLSPARACEDGDHAEAVRVLRVASGLRTRPVGFVASLPPCFATDDVGVSVAALDSLISADCDIQGVTELQKLGLESPSDPEIRIAAFRGLVHCLPEQPNLIKIVEDALDPTHDEFSTQVASFVWSHVQSVLKSDDPSQIALKDMLISSKAIRESRDPVWYDPRRHSRHVSHTIDVDSRTSITVSFDLVWGRYSPAPRAFYLHIVLHHDGETNDLSQVMIRVTGIEKMLLNFPGAETVMDFLSYVVGEVKSKVYEFAETSLRTKRAITHVQIAEFIDHVMSRIPADYRSGISSAELSLRILDNHALHIRMTDLHNTSYSESIRHLLQTQLDGNILGLMPLLDNTLSLATISGVPVSLGANAVSGVNGILRRIMRDDGGILKLLASGGIAMNTHVSFGRYKNIQESQGNPPVALQSKFLWSLDVPFHASYEYQGEATRITIRTADDFNGGLWEQRRDTTVAGKKPPLWVTQDCLGTGEPLEICLNTLGMDDPGGVEAIDTIPGLLPKGWLIPYANKLLLKNIYPGESIIITTSSPNVPGAWISRAVIEVGVQEYEGSFVLQAIPTPTIAITVNSPAHAYLMKAYAGARESTKMAGIEITYDSRKYGIRGQLSTPTPENTRVWSPSLFISTPDGEAEEEEIIRAFLSIKDSRDEQTTVLLFQTLGPLVDYLNFDFAVDTSWSFNLYDGSLQSLVLKKLRLVHPEIVTINAEGNINVARRREGDFSLVVKSPENADDELILNLSAGPVVQFLSPLPQDLVEGEREGSSRGMKYKVDLTVKHNQLPEVVQTGFDLLLDRGRVDASLNFYLAETGGFNVSHISNGPLDIKTTAMVHYEPLQISWGAEHELLMREDEFRHFMKASWSSNPQDHASSLVHYTNHNLLALDRSLKLVLMYPGQILELEDSVAEDRAGSINNKLEIRMDPGTSIQMDTVFISRDEIGVFSYGVSNTFKLDTWIYPLILVGTLNCVGDGKCSIVMAANKGGDQLADVEIQHASVLGISRSDAKITIQNWLDGSISLDSSRQRGFYDMKWDFAFWPLEVYFEGLAEMNLLSIDMAKTEMIVYRLLDDTVGEVVSAFNATITYNPDIRALSSRQEVRFNGDGPVQLWVGVVQGRLGPQMLNSRHFGKATLVTSSGMYYTLNGDVDSHVLGLESVKAGISISADAGPDVSYLLSWDFDFQQPNKTSSETLIGLRTLTEEVDIEEQSGVNYTDPLLDTMRSPLKFEVSSKQPTITLQTLIRGNSPTTGEIKLKVKARKTEFSDGDAERYLLGDGDAEGDDGTGLQSEKFDADIRLISENNPEMGRIHGSLTRSSGVYSLNGRMWSGLRSFGIVSYGMARNDSVKTSHQAILVDPMTSWRKIDLALNSDHLGSFPYNFQTSTDGRLSCGFEEVGAVRAMAQWTPIVTALDLGFHSNFQYPSDGNILFKLSPDSWHGSLGWHEMKSVALLQWAEEGRAFQIALNYDNPDAPFNDLDAIIKFAISQAPYPPITLAVNGRISINSLYHYILNVDCQSQQEEYLVIGALVRPSGSGSLRLQLKRAEDIYGAIGALVIDGFSAQISGSFTQLRIGEELKLTIHSSMLEETNGYALKIIRNFDNPNAAEMVFVFSQGGDQPGWIYTYKLLLEMERDIKNKLRRLRVEDHLTYVELEDLLHDYNFLILVVHNKFDEMEIEIEFPDIWAEVKVAGTIVKGKDSQLDFVFATPSIKHLLEGRLIFGSNSWLSSHSGSFSYTQQGKKGRGQPLKLELEGSKWNSDRKKFKLSMQKMVDEFSIAEYMLDDNAYSPNDVGTLFTHFDAALDVSNDPGSTEYKISWETDETENSANFVIVEDQSGGKGSFKYFRDIKGRPKSEVEYEVKVNYRRFKTEVTLSATLDHTHIDRPRAVSFLNSDAEGYTELVLDLFEDEGDQVIFVVTYLPENFRIRVGQFGNTFLQVGYQKTNDVDDILHVIQLESSGHSIDLSLSSSPDGIRTCRKGGITLQTPTLAPTHNAIQFCPAPAPEITIQILGVEEHEGPYLRIGQISGPGGVGVQLGSGRLLPLDTPPALTLTTDVEEEVLEVLIDWQSPSIAQLKEEVTSRGTSIVSAVEGFRGFQVDIEGSMDLWDLLEETEILFEEFFDLLESAGTYVLNQVLIKDSEIHLGTLLTISGSKIVEYLSNTFESPINYLLEWSDHLIEVTESYLEVIEEIIEEVFEEVTYAFDDAAQMITEGINDIWDIADTIFRPPFLRIQAATAALTYNDDQTLYALVSRIMGDIWSKTGRQDGYKGFISANILTRLEKWLVRMARWEEVKAAGSNLLHYLSQLTTFDAIMPHSAALNLRVATPTKLVHDLKEKGNWFKEERLPQLLHESYVWLDGQWTRARYLTSWHVHGESVVFGWDQAITWDGRQVMPMLTDSCHHMLALLINARTPTAVTIHLKDLESSPRKVFTFFSGTDRVTIDTNLKMTYNNQQVRRPLLEIDELTLRWSPNLASVTSASGLSLQCENLHDTCRLEVSWENFAATAGLLGVFDFDNNTDFMTSGWEMPATEEEWAQSWRVASMEECSSALPEPEIFQHPESECSLLYDQSISPFRSCFFSIPPSPYLETCRSGWACGAEIAYMHACQGHYHQLEANMTTCDMCDLHGSEEYETDDLRQEIVVITDFDCLEDMQDLLTALVKNMHADDYKLILRYIGRGTPSYGPFYNVTETIVDSATSPLDAVWNAVNLDFSQRAFKSIVLFDCDHPKCTVSMESPDLIALRDDLLEQGIQLHMITQDPLQILHHDALSNKAKRQLIGVDAKTSYTMAHARKRHVKGKRRWREHVNIPLGNTCAQIAIQSDGSVFSLYQLKIDRKYHRKIYQQLIAARVKEGQNADYLSCRKCHCGSPCHLCHPPPPFTYTKPARDFFEDEDDDEDYDDEQEEFRGKKKKKKKSNKPRRNRQG